MCGSTHKKSGGRAHAAKGRQDPSGAVRTVRRELPDRLIATPPHLLGALLVQTDGIVYPLLSQLGIVPADLKAAVEASLAGVPESLPDAPRVLAGPTQGRAY